MIKGWKGSMIGLFLVPIIVYVLCFAEYLWSTEDLHFVPDFVFFYHFNYIHSSRHTSSAYRIFLWSHSCFQLGLDSLISHKCALVFLLWDRIWNMGLLKAGCLLQRYLRTPWVPPSKLTMLVGTFQRHVGIQFITSILGIIKAWYCTDTHGYGLWIVHHIAIIISKHGMGFGNSFNNCFYRKKNSQCLSFIYSSIFSSTRSKKFVHWWSTDCTYGSVFQ